MDLLRFYYTQNPTPMEDEALFDAYNERKKTIQIIQLLRMISALIFFLSHMFDARDNPNATMQFVGRTGVAFFFLISGFLLIYTDRGQTKGYFIKRIIRIVPLYYLTTLFVFAIGLVKPDLLHTAESSAESLLKSLCFIPFYSGDTILPLYPITWTLTLEIYVYVIYFIPLLLQNKFGLFPNNAKQFKGITVSILLIIPVILRPFVTKNIFTETYGMKCILYFVIGILTATFWDYLIKYRKPIKLPENPAVSAVIAIILCFGIVAYSTVFTENILNILLIGILFVVLLFIFWDYSFPKLFVTLGNISYSFYLIHYFTVKMYLRLIQPMFSTGIIGNILMQVLCYIITAAISYVCYQIIEKQFSNVLRNTFLKPKSLKSST